MLEQPCRAGKQPEHIITRNSKDKRKVNAKPHAENWNYLEPQTHCDVRVARLLLRQQHMSYGQTTKRGIHKRYKSGSNTVYMLTKQRREMIGLPKTHPSLTGPPFSHITRGSDEGSELALSNSQ